MFQTCCISTLRANGRLGHIFFFNSPASSRANLEFNCCRITLFSVQKFVNNPANPSNLKYVTTKAILCWLHISFELFLNGLETTLPGQIFVSILKRINIVLLKVHRICSCV